MSRFHYLGSDRIRAFLGGEPSGDFYGERAAVINSPGLPDGCEPPSTSLDVPRHNVICAHLFDDETICREPAGPDHTHDGPPLRDPAPGLFQQMTGKPLPTYSELRQKYGDPAVLPPLLTPEQAIKASEVIAASGITTAQALERIEEAQAALRNPAPPERVDFRDMLKDDEQPWSPRSRLAAALGRPALATRLADVLPPALAAELADRLDTLITQALSEQQAAITQDISDRYHEARARLEADAQAKLKEVHDERYRGRPSRLS